MKTYISSPLDFIDQASSRRMRYDIDVKMNYMPHTGRKFSLWNKTKRHITNVVSAFSVAKAEDLHQIWLMTQEDKIPPVFGPIALAFHDATKRSVALSSITLGESNDEIGFVDKLELWRYEDDAKFQFVPAFVYEAPRTMPALNVQFPQVQIPKELTQLVK